MGIDIRKHFESSEGILRLIPNFVPRRFSYPGKRLRLHPDDYYALGTKRGAIKERWFSSVISAMNGPLAPADEGMSYVSFSDDASDRYLFKDAVEELKADIIGSTLYDKYGTWPMYSKFFDYRAPLFHHLHLGFDDAKRVGMLGKPEAYYFPFQLNNFMGDFPVTYFGYDPDVTKEEVKERLLKYEDGDNKITELSRAYRIELGTGWYTPPGVVHAPGSVLTYEPQWNSDVNSVHENITSEEVYSYDFLVENCPEDKRTDIDYILGLLDWEKNVDPHYRKKYFRPPIDCSPPEDGVTERWITYGNEYIGAKELTIAPGASCIHKDEVAFGCIIIQGNGRFGKYEANAASMLRYGQLSSDEYFVSEKAASEGLKIVNHNKFEPMVILKHFGPNHPKMPW